MVLEKLLKFGFLLGGRFVIDEIELQQYFVLFFDTNAIFEWRWEPSTAWQAVTCSVFFY